MTNFQNIRIYKNFLPIKLMAIGVIAIGVIAQFSGLVAIMGSAILAKLSYHKFMSKIYSVSTSNWGRLIVANQTSALAEHQAELAIKRGKEPGHARDTIVEALSLQATTLALAAAAVMGGGVLSQDSTFFENIRIYKNFLPGKFMAIGILAIGVIAQFSGLAALVGSAVLAALSFYKFMRNINSVSVPNLNIVVLANKLITMAEQQAHLAIEPQPSTLAQNLAAAGQLQRISFTLFNAIVFGDEKLKQYAELKAEQLSATYLHQKQRLVRVLSQIQNTITVENVREYSALQSRRLSSASLRQASRATTLILLGIYKTGLAAGRATAHLRSTVTIESLDDDVEVLGPYHDNFAMERYFASGYDLAVKNARVIDRRIEDSLELLTWLYILPMILIFFMFSEDAKAKRVVRDVGEVFSNISTTASEGLYRAANKSADAIEMGVRPIIYGLEKIGEHAANAVIEEAVKQKVIRPRRARIEQ